MNANARLLGSARDAPLYFAGRRSELDVLRERLEHIRRTGDPRGGLALIDGIQGVGKTQLLKQFASAAAKERGTAVPHVPTSGLANELALFANIVDALGGTDDMARQMADAAGGVTSAKIASNGVSTQRPAPLNLSINDMLVRSKRRAVAQQNAHHRRGRDPSHRSGGPTHPQDAPRRQARVPDPAPWRWPATRHHAPFPRTRGDRPRHGGNVGNSRGAPAENPA